MSSLVVVKKPSGKIRICIDPKPLNQALKRSLYLLPVIEDVLPKLGNAKIFTVCDIKNGFWHVVLDEESSKLTTFETPFLVVSVGYECPLVFPLHRNSFSNV